MGDGGEHDQPFALHVRLIKFSNPQKNLVLEYINDMTGKLPGERSMTQFPCMSFSFPVINSSQSWKDNREREH